MKYNFTGLKNIYSVAMDSVDPTIAFEINNGVGHFVFMMFLSKEEAQKNDRLFIYFRNINTLHNIKLYGSHKSGDFIAYINEVEIDLIRRELNLQGGEQAFNIGGFLNAINSSIPQHLSPAVKGDTLRSTWPNVSNQMTEFVDDANKTILIGLKTLRENTRARDKTLRKLYLYVNGQDKAISDFIKEIKKRPLTLAWTSDPTKTAKSFAQLLMDFASK